MASVRKRTWKSGDKEKTKWVADYFDQAGKRHLRTFRTKGDADAWLDETKQEVKLRTHMPSSAKLTVEEAAKAWLTQAKADGLERSTTEQYDQHVRLHIVPKLGRQKIAMLSVETIADFRNQLQKDGRSRIMIKKVVSSLGSILAEARVARNVVREQALQTRKRERRVERRQIERPEVGKQIPTKAEIRQMLDAAQEVAEKWYALIATAIFTGLRASELRGLLWDDVDLVRRPPTITVRQRADRWLAIGTPKSASATREVPLVPEVVNALRRWRLSCPRNADGALEYVFPNGVGKIETLPNIHRRGLGPVQVKAGICSDKLRPRYGMHSFRHAAASLFIEQGLSPKRVQGLMGHSTIAMTLDTYTHVWPSDAEDEEMLQRIQDGMRLVPSH